MTELVRKESKIILKKLLSECTEGQQLIFKRIYSSRNLGLTINDVVDQL